MSSKAGAIYKAQLSIKIIRPLKRSVTVGGD
jgi:hypothetical protein